MTAKERVLTSRLIEKIDVQRFYSQKIGLGYDLGEKSPPIVNFKSNWSEKAENNVNAKE